MRVPARGRRYGQRVSSRPHWAARAEDQFNAILGSRLRRRGWLVRAEAYTGYGNPRQVRLLARTLLARPGRVRPGPSSGAGLPEPSAARDEPRFSYEPMRAVPGVRNFLAAAAMHQQVTISLGGKTFQATSDRGGYLDLMVDVALEPGWHEAVLTTVDGDTVRLPVQIIGDDVTFGVVSDIDDTVMVTYLPRPLLAGWNAFVLSENARRVVPGMPVLYAEIQHRHPGTPTFYLSTGAWNVAPVLRRFLAAHGFPPGPLLLTDWGPTNSGFFRSGREHKQSELRALLALFPQIRWMLIGDDGQHDPQIYGELAAEHPDRVRAIVLRELTGSEHVLAHGAPGVVIHAPRSPDIPQAHGADGSVLLRVLEQSGLL